MDADVALLEAHPPFSEMTPDELRLLVASAERDRYRDGELVLEVGGEPSEALFVVVHGSIELLRDGEVLDLLEPGEAFGFPSLLSGRGPAFDVRARGETACLRIGREATQRVLGTPAGLRFLTLGIGARAALAERTDPAGIHPSIAEAVTGERLAEVASGIPGAMARLRREGLDAGAVARAVAGALDAVTRRALVIAIREAGEPPAPWAWLAFGSVARREPGLDPDQDTTIVWDGEPADDAYFAAVAASVTEVLSRAGFPPCPSGVVAIEPGWRGSMETWLERLLRPSGRPSRAAFVLAFALDLRKVAGPLQVTELGRRVASAAREKEHLWRVTRLALEQRPPVGALGGMLTDRQDDGRRSVDVKQGGLLPVVDLARLVAVQADVDATSTLERLRDAHAASVLGPEEARALDEAFRTFAELRLDRQIECLDAGLPLDARVEPGSLDPISRTRLRQAFRVVEHVQDRLRRELGIGHAG